jgi:hypothetical protein
MPLKIGDLQQIKGGEFLGLSERGEPIVGGRGFKGWLKVQWLNVKMFFSKAERTRYMEQNRKVMYAFIQKMKDVYGEKWGDLVKKRLQMDIIGGRRLTGFKIQALLKEAHKTALEKFKENVATFKRTLFREDPDKYIASAAEAVKVFSKYQAEGLSCPRKVIKAINEIKAALQNLTERSVGGLSDKSLKALKDTLAALELHHLDEAIAGEIEARIESAKQRYEQLTSTFLSAINEKKDLFEVLSVVKDLQGDLTELFNKGCLFEDQELKKMPCQFMEFVSEKLKDAFGDKLGKIAELEKFQDDWKKLVEALSQDKVSLKKLLEMAYNISCRCYLGIKEELAIDVLAWKRERIQEMLEKSELSDEQLLKIYITLTSTPVMRLKEELAGLSERNAQSQAERIALDRFKSTADTLDVLESILEKEIDKRELILLPKHISFSDMSINRVVNECIERVKRYFEISYGQEVKKEINKPDEIPPYFYQMLIPDTREVTTRINLTHPETGEEIEVCEGFEKDFTRNTYQIVKDSQEIEKINSTGTDVPKKEIVEGMLRLKEFVGRDKEYFFKICQFANHFSLACITEWMGYGQKDKTVLIIDGKRYLHLREQFTTYSFSKNEQGEVELSIKVLERLGGIMDFSTSFIIPLDRDASYYQYGLTLVVPKEGDVKVKDVFYKYKMQPGFEIRSD